MKIKPIQKSDFFKVALSAIVVEKGFNVRQDMGDIDALAKSIAAIGQISPVTATKIRGEEKFKLTAGHRRLAAIHLANEKYGAGITQVNVMGASGDEKTRVLTMLLDGEGAKKLTASEMAAGFKRLKDEFGMKPKEIGEKVGLSQAQVYNIIAVANSPLAIQKMVEKGEISVALVNEIQRTTKDATEQVKLANEAVESAQAKAPEGKKKKATSSHANTSKVSADVAKLEAALALVEPTLAKAALLKSIINKLKAKASAEDIAKLLK